MLNITRRQLFKQRQAGTFGNLSKRLYATIYDTPDEAVADIPHGSTIAMGGFACVGVPENLITALGKKGSMDLTWISNDVGLNKYGLDLLVCNKQVKKIICSFLGENKNIVQEYFNGHLTLELVPQGSFAEKLRAAGAGIPAFYTSTGIGTIIGDGGVVQKFSPGGSEFEKVSIHKEMRIFNGQPYMLVHSIKSDYAFVKGHTADELGNVTFNKSAMNFNVDVAKSGKKWIVEVENIVPAGSMDPHHIHLPHIYVHRLVKGPHYIKPIEKYTIKKEGGNASESDVFNTPEGKIKKKIAQRAAQLVKNKMYINLGIGIPVFIANFIDKSLYVTFHSENGILGLGEFPYAHEVDADLINAGRQTVTIVNGGSYMSSSESFAMIRGGHLDITFLGGMQVSEKGDLANWIIPGKMLKGMGGGMDLVAGTKKKVIVMQHWAKNGRPKVLRDCTLPLTGTKTVNTLITEKAVFEWNKKGKMILTDVAKESSLEDIRANTEAIFEVATDLKQF